MWRASNIFTPFVIGALFFSVVFLFSLNPIRESDTGFLIKTGEYVWETRSVPRTDIFSYTAFGAEWIAHYWLPGLFFFGIESFFGAWGIILSVGCIALFAFFFIFKIVKLRSHSIWIPLLSFFFFFSLTFRLWSARPQIFSYVFSALILFVLYSFRKKRNIKTLIAIPFIMFFWANTHAGVVLGFAILVLFFFAEILDKKFVCDKECILTLFIILCAIAVAFANPNGYKVFTYSQIIAPVAEELGVMEWFSILERLGTWQAKSFLALMFFSFLFIIRVTHMRMKEEKYIDIFSLGILFLGFILPFFSIRHVIFFSILVFPIFVWYAEWFAQKKSLHIEEFLRTRFSGILSFSLFLLVFAGGVSFSREVSSGTVDRSILPVGVSDFIVRERVGGPFFNLENGGYFIWKFWPEERVFFDGRNEVYKGEPLREYLTIARQDDGWENLVDEKYSINGFILWYRPPLDIFANNLTVRLMRGGVFSLVYWDDAGILLLRNNRENENIVRRFGYRVINPFRNPIDIDDEDIPRAEEEMRIAKAFAPDSFVLAEYEKGIAIKRATIGQKLVQ